MRKVTEQDLRMPEFRDANIDDLEFRADGKLVRKDRWEQGIRSICSVLGMSPGEDFEIADVIEAVETLVAKTDSAGWIPWAGGEYGECPVEPGTKCAVRLRDGTTYVCSTPAYLVWSHFGSSRSPGHIISYRVLP